MNLSSLRHHLFLGVALFAFGATPVLAQESDAPSAMPQGQTPTVFDNVELVKHYQATITPEDLAAHLYFFASDYFEGRETATRGQKMAAYYLAAQYRKIGINPKGTAETDDPRSPEVYLQPFPLHGTRLASAGIEVMSGNETVATATYGPSETSGDLYLTFGNLEESEGGVVFAGYGIGDDDLGYNDYSALTEKGLNLGGKWVLMLRDEPLKDAETSLFSTEDGSPSKWTTQPFAKLQAVFSSGGFPAGVLMVGDVGPNAANIAENAQKRAEAVKNDVGSLSLNEQGPSRPLPPIYTISTELANKMIASSGKTIADLQKSIDANLTPEVFEVEGVTVKSTLSNEKFTTTSENVAAYIEGSDPDLKDEFVVVSSHYDHIGISSTSDGDIINNGADDDGSGTVGVLEIAEAFMQAKRDGYGPRRSILFLNVSGEEKGLLGSAYYTDIEPIVPLEKTVTNLNIDMIGRYDPTHPDEDLNYVYIIGSNLISQELHDINAKVNEMTGIDMILHERFNSKDDPNQFYRRSDHWNFGKKNIPFIFFFTGTHEDYHGVDDEAHKIEYERLADISRVIFATAWQVANQDAPPAVSGTGFN